MSLVLSGCSTPSSTTFSQPADETSYSQAYLDGYNGNVGASAALISNSGGPNDYCQSVLLLQMYDTTSEENDYIQGCLDVLGSNAASTGEADIGSVDLLSDLQSIGGDTWYEDAFTPANPPAGFVSNYIADGYCTLWAFESGDLAAEAAQAGFLDNFTTYSYSWGTDASGLGVIAMYEDSYSACANDMLEVLGWGNWP
jgi:hypothetical protein